MTLYLNNSFKISKGNVISIKNYHNKYFDHFFKLCTNYFDLKYKLGMFTQIEEKVIHK